ncbi:MAG: phage head-tail connector protein [Rhizomicrobium sp.]
MAIYDLCTLADVKAWLGRSDANSDAVLASLITRTSRQIQSYLRRGLLLPRSVTELRDGTGGTTLVLRQWPVVSLASLAIGRETILPRAAPGAAGWALEPWDGVPPGRAQTLSLAGHCFVRRALNVEIVYRAGYQVTAEAQTVANSGATVLEPYGDWASDGGVTYADGTPLVAVTGAPQAGQYQLTPNAPGSYTFNAGDNGAAVRITYGFVPADLADACIELVSERFRYLQRIGERTHSLGGNETVSFDPTRFTPLVVSLLQPYRHVLPI